MGLKSLKDLKEEKAPVTPAPVAGTPAPAKEKKEKAPKAEGEKKASGLTPKVKDPEKAKEEAEATAAITSLLKATPAGLMASELREQIYEGLTQEEFSGKERLIRALCRKMNCTVTPIENSRKVRYSLK